jgi:hypothetical protein
VLYRGVTGIPPRVTPSPIGGIYPSRAESRFSFSAMRAETNCYIIQIVVSCNLLRWDRSLLPLLLLRFGGSVLYKDELH